MEVLRPIFYEPENMIIIREPFDKFLCTFCKSEDKEHCGIKIMEDSFPLHDIDTDYKKYLFNKIEETNTTNILLAVSEPILVKYRKELYVLSKEIFSFKQSLTQFLFTNTDFFDLLHLKSAYKYLTYVDYIMQNRNIANDNRTETEINQNLNCLFENAIYISLTKSFTSGKLVLKN